MALSLLVLFPKIARVIGIGEMSPGDALGIDPGVIVKVQVAPGSKVSQVVVIVVPEGKSGEVEKIID